MTARPTKRQANIGSKEPIIAPSSLKASRPNSCGLAKDTIAEEITFGEGRGQATRARRAVFLSNAIAPQSFVRTKE